MYVAVKDNKRMPAAEADVAAYIALGYDIFAAEQGGLRLVTYGAGKKVPVEELIALRAQLQAAEAENKQLREQVRTLSKKRAKPKQAAPVDPPAAPEEEEE